MSTPNGPATIVVGGGIGGLATAACLARAGRSVTVFERAGTLGGRAATHTEHGFHFNLGPHALYRGGPAMRVLDALGVNVSGSVPNASGGYAIRGGRLHALPGGFVSLLTTGLLPLPAKLELGRCLTAIGRMDGQRLGHLNVRQWLDGTVRQPAVRSLVEALVRLTTYVNAPETMSAATALTQLQPGLSSKVLYLDGGWQTLVNGLRRAAVEAGARIETGVRVERVTDDDGVRGVRLGDGTFRRADAVVLAVGRELVARFCLNISRHRLPMRTSRFASSPACRRSSAPSATPVAATLHVPCIGATSTPAAASRGSTRSLPRASSAPSASTANCVRRGGRACPTSASTADCPAYRTSPERRLA